MILIEERKRIQDKLVLLNGKELAEVDAFVEELFSKRRKFADIIRERE